MSPPEPRRIPTAVAAPVSAGQLPVVPVAGGAALMLRVHAAYAVVARVWVPRTAWAIGRTGRTGLAGLALLVGSALFFASTQQQLSEEISQQRSDLAEAQAREAQVGRAEVVDPLKGLRSLPARAEVPDVLGKILQEAQDAQLTIDTAKYEIGTTKSGSIVRYQLAFPVDGTYPQIRRFIDSVLTALPELSVDQIAIARKSIGDPTVEAQLRMTIFTKGAP